MRILQLLISFLMAGITITGCQSDASVLHSDVPALDKEFINYWYIGKAEVNSYALKQARYGELHDGLAVLIFVTEPFSEEKHVKLDNPMAGNDKISVMKLNYIKKFHTGVYPYSMMQSTFTPIDLNTHQRSFKNTMSSQEWCGHVFSQMNLVGKSYKTRSFSYFEQEVDQEQEVDAVLLEDEIWNRIRLDYKSLPMGKISILPGLFYTRLAHTKLETQVAVASLDVLEGHDKATYKIEYPNRILSVTFETLFPYQILQWEETYQGIGGKTLSTTATLKKSMVTDYWNKNKLGHHFLRDSLQLH